MSLMGHECWSKDPDSAARYALAVSFEVVGREIAICDCLRVVVEELQSELETEIEVDVEANPSAIWRLMRRISANRNVPTRSSFCCSD